MRSRQLIAAGVLVLALVVGLVALTLPSNSTDDAYCAGYQTYNASIATLDPSDTAAVDQVIVKANTAASSAPQDLQDDWQVLIHFLELIKSSEGDQAKLQSSLTPSEPARINEAIRTIGTHAQQNCGTDTETA
jgi:hypothetical protein